LSRELLDDGGNESRERVRGADPDFARSPVGQKFDVPDALLQLVEGGNAALKERTAYIVKAACPHDALPEASRLCFEVFYDEIPQALYGRRHGSNWRSHPCLASSAYPSLTSLWMANTQVAYWWDRISDR
jgi:hypothetical protein